MSCRMPEPVVLPFWAGQRTILKRDAMLIRITTDTGLKGYAPGPAHERADRDIKEQIGPFLVGKDPCRWKEWLFTAEPEVVKTYRAVEIALLDLAARYEGCPLSDLLGGRKRNRIKLYGSAGMYMEPKKYAEEAQAVIDMGFPAYKMRPGMGPDKDLETISLMRKAVGSDAGLMVDAHTWWRMGDKSYSFDTIAKLISDMKDYHPVWLEEPLPPDDHNSYCKLREQSDVKLASGEHEQDDAGFENLINSQAIDYVQMDILCQGGISSAWRIFDAVRKSGLRFAFHSWGTILEVLAAAQLGVCWPEDVVEWLEYPCYSHRGPDVMYPFPLADEILDDTLNIDNGYLILPNGTGMGIDVDETVIEKYPFIPGPWSIFKLDSSAETVAVTGDHSLKWDRRQQA